MSFDTGGFTAPIVLTGQQKATKRRSDAAGKLTTAVRQESKMTAQAKACAQVARAPFYRNAATSSRSVKRWNPPSLMSYELMRSSALKAVAEAMSSHGSNVGGDATASLMANPRKWERLQLHGLDAISSLCRGVMMRHAQAEAKNLEEGVTERDRKNPVEMLARALVDAEAAAAVTTSLLSAVDAGERELRRVKAVKAHKEHVAKEAAEARIRAHSPVASGSDDDDDDDDSRSMLSPSASPAKVVAAAAAAPVGDSKIHPFVARWLARAVQALCAVASVRDHALHSALLDVDALLALARAMSVHMELMHGDDIYERLAMTVKMKKAAGGLGGMPRDKRGSPPGSKRGSPRSGRSSPRSPRASHRGPTGPDGGRPIYHSTISVQQDGCATMMAMLDVEPLPRGFAAVLKADGIPLVTRAMQYGLLAGKDIARTDPQDLDFTIGLQSCACCVVAKMLAVATIASSVKVKPPAEVNVIRKRKLRARLKEARADMAPHKHHLMLQQTIDGMGTHGLIEVRCATCVHEYPKLTCERALILFFFATLPFSHFCVVLPFRACRCSSP
jgi:hypothetical protein